MTIHANAFEAGFLLAEDLRETDRSSASAPERVGCAVDCAILPASRDDVKQPNPLSLEWQDGGLWRAVSLKKATAVLRNLRGGS
jgi:hypothetical protein